MTPSERVSADLPGVRSRLARIPDGDVVRIADGSPVFVRPHPVRTVRPTPFAPALLRGLPGRFVVVGDSRGHRIFCPMYATALGR